VLTVESLDADPALDAHPDLPAVFVFDAPLLARLQLSGKRLVFLAGARASEPTDQIALVARRRPANAVPYGHGGSEPQPCEVSSCPALESTT
jgi:hypothetical protein